MRIGAPPAAPTARLGGRARTAAVAGPAARRPRTDPSGSGFFAEFTLERSAGPRMTSSLLSLLRFMSAHDRRAVQGAKLVAYDAGYLIDSETSRQSSVVSCQA